MKLFWCPKCEKWWDRGAVIHIEVRCGLDSQKGLLYIDDDGCDTGFHELSELVKLSCPECERPMEVRELQQCPHEWEILWSDKAQRTCVFCGVVQRGRVEWGGEV